MKLTRAALVSTNANTILKTTPQRAIELRRNGALILPILAEGAIALSVTHSGGALFAS